MTSLAPHLCGHHSGEVGPQKAVLDERIPKLWLNLEELPPLGTLELLCR